MIPLHLVKLAKAGFLVLTRATKGLSSWQEVINMDAKKASVKCKEGEYLLEKCWEEDGRLVCDYSCTVADPSWGGEAKVCHPAKGSKYVMCRVMECPEGFGPALVHIADPQDPRAALGLSCLPVARSRASRSLWDRLLGEMTSIPG